MFFIKRTHQKYIQFDNKTSKNANKLAHHHKKRIPNIKVIHKHVSQKRYVCKRRHKQQREKSSTSHKIQHIAKSNAIEKTSINDFILQYIAFNKIPKAGGEGNIPSLFLATDS